MNRESTLTRRNPFEEVRTLGWPLSRFFDDVFGRMGLRVEEGDQMIAPATDISEDDHAITVTLELPGMTKSDVKITVENGVLTVSGEKKSEAESKGTSWHRMERRYGTFFRAITLPSTVSGEKADAHFKDGVLTIRVPKSEAAKPRSIQIQ
jgi:HSP20 family protein